MEHIIGGQTDASHQSLDGVLKGEHQDGRCCSQACNECRGILIDDNRDDHDGSYEDHQDLQHATDAVEILLARGTRPMIDLLERVDEDDDRTGGHHREIDGRQAPNHISHLRIFEEHQRQQRPDDNGRDDARGRDKHPFAEDHIVPLRISLTCNLRHQWYNPHTAQFTSQPRQDEGQHYPEGVTHHWHVIARQSRQTDDPFHKKINLVHHSQRALHILSWKSRPSLFFITPWLMIQKASM